MVLAGSPERRAAWLTFMAVLHGFRLLRRLRLALVHGGVSPVAQMQ
jgi:hypothetical protein